MDRCATACHANAVFSRLNWWPAAVVVKTISRRGKRKRLRRTTYVSHERPIPEPSVFLSPAHNIMCVRCTPVVHAFTCQRAISSAKLTVAMYAVKFAQSSVAEIFSTLPGDGRKNNTSAGRSRRNLFLYVEPVGPRRCLILFFLTLDVMRAGRSAVETKLRPAKITFSDHHSNTRPPVHPTIE